MSEKDAYLDAIREHLDLADHRPMWPLGQDVEVGTIGTFESDAFRPNGHLQDFETFELDRPDERPDGLTYGSKNGLDFQVEIGGATGAILKPLTDVELALRLTFRSENQVALRAVGVRFARVRNEREFGRRIINAFWNRHVAVGDYFVSGVMVADSGAVAVAAERGATLELTGRGDVTPAADIGLANLKASISIAGTSKTSLAVPMTEGFVVAFRVLKLAKEGIFGDPIAKRAISDAAHEELILGFDEAKPPLTA